MSDKKIIHYEGIKLDNEIVSFLLRKIIIAEAKNLKTKQYTPSQMVKEIMDMIEEEVKCY